MAKGYFQSNLYKVIKDFETKCDAQLVKAVYRVHREVTKTLTGRRSGRTYKIPSTARTYVASAPYEAPAVRTGDLRTSYRPRVEGRGSNAIGYVGSPLEYAEFLEYGTRKMAKRPHLRISFEKSQKDVENLFKDLL